MTERRAKKYRIKQQKKPIQFSTILTKKIQLDKMKKVTVKQLSVGQVYDAAEQELLIAFNCLNDHHHYLYSFFHLKTGCCLHSSMYNTAIWYDLVHPLPSNHTSLLLSCGYPSRSFSVFLFLSRNLHPTATPS